jgi:hypothetical protein
MKILYILFKMAAKELVIPETLELKNLSVYINQVRIKYDAILGAPGLSGWWTANTGEEAEIQRGIAEGKKYLFDIFTGWN